MNTREKERIDESVHDTGYEASTQGDSKKESQYERREEFTAALSASVFRHGDTDYLQHVETAFLIKRMKKWKEEASASERDNVTSKRARRMVSSYEKLIDEIYKHRKPDLNARGESGVDKEAEEFAATLQQGTSVVFWESPSWRTRATTDIIANTLNQHGIPYEREIMPELEDVSVKADDPDLYIKNLEDNFFRKNRWGKSLHDPSITLPDGMEKPDEVFQRFNKIMGRLYERAEEAAQSGTEKRLNKHYVLVTHAGLPLKLLDTLFRDNPGTSKTAELERGKSFLMEIDPTHKKILVTLNREQRMISFSPGDTNYKVIKDNGQKYL